MRRRRQVMLGRGQHDVDGGPARPWHRKRGAVGGVAVEGVCCQVGEAVLILYGREIGRPAFAFDQGGGEQSEYKDRGALMHGRFIGWKGPED